MSIDPATIQELTALVAIERTRGGPEVAKETDLQILRRLLNREDPDEGLPPVAPLVAERQDIVDRCNLWKARLSQLSAEMTAINKDVAEANKRMAEIDLYLLKHKIPTKQALGILRGYEARILKEKKEHWYSSSHYWHLTIDFPWITKTWRSGDYYADHAAQFEPTQEEKDAMRVLGITYTLSEHEDNDRWGSM